MFVGLQGYILHPNFREKKKVCSSPLSLFPVRSVKFYPRQSLNLVWLVHPVRSVGRYLLLRDRGPVEGELDHGAGVHEPKAEGVADVVPCAVGAPVIGLDS